MSTANDIQFERVISLRRSRYASGELLFTWAWPHLEGGKQPHQYKFELKLNSEFWSLFERVRIKGIGLSFNAPNLTGDDMLRHGLSAVVFPPQQLRSEE